MFDLTRQEYDEIKAKLMLSDELSKILEMKIKGCSVTEIAMKMNLSERTANRRIREIKKKIMKMI